MDDTTPTTGSGVPVIAVMPFAIAGTADTPPFMAQGLHEDICAALSRFRSLGVISPHSALTVAACDDAEIGRLLGASHVLRGRLGGGDGRLRLSSSLVATAEAHQLWTDQIDLESDDPFALRDEIVARVASSLHARLDEVARSEIRRGGASPATNGMVLHALALMRAGTLAADAAARAIFEEVLVRDPASARAHAGIALSWFNEWSCQFWDRFDETSRLAYHHAHRALDLDEGDGMVHLIIAKVQLFRRAFESASWYLDRALALCPNDADLLVQAALCEIYLGRPETAIEHVSRGMRLHPYHPNVYFGIGALAHFFARDLDTALAMAAKADRMPFVDASAFSASALAHAGRIDEARQALTQFHADFTEKIAFGAPVPPGEPVRWFLRMNPFRRPEDLAHVAAGLERLGETMAPASSRLDVPGAARLFRTQTGWNADFAGQRVALPDLKGLHDLRRLLERPGEEVHCLDLAERSETAYGADAALDDRARAALKARIRDLSEELAEAEDMNDIGRAERARSEMDALVEALSHALGLGGRDRRLGDLAERARTTVTWRLRYAQRKVVAAHPALGRHLVASVRTGVFCVYQPEMPVAWSFDEPAIAVPA
jgi:TolB-like protein/tetratricopeptide (TPR) repeat protein